MSGHSKWSTIKHKKGAQDAKRGQLFTKLSREIMVAARSGDPNPDMNFRLRLAVDNAKSQNMPKENIERAIEKGSGNPNSSEQLYEIIYEGYGPGGVGLLINVLTDNKNRSAAAVRSCITRIGGNLASNASVSWNFENKGMISIVTDQEETEILALKIMDIGADDIEINDNLIDITVNYQEFSSVKNIVEKIPDLKIEKAEIIQVPNSSIELNDTESNKMLKLLNDLEELDDVTKVFSNADFTEESIIKFTESL